MNDMSSRIEPATDETGLDAIAVIGIAGRFYTDGTLAGNMDRALQVTDYLVAELRKGR